MRGSLFRGRSIKKLSRRNIPQKCFRELWKFDTLLDHHLTEIGTTRKIQSIVSFEKSQKIQKLHYENYKIFLKTRRQLEIDTSIAATTHEGRLSLRFYSINLCYT